MKFCDDLKVISEYERGEASLVRETSFSRKENREDSDTLSRDRPASSLTFLVEQAVWEGCLSAGYSVWEQI